MKFIAVPIFMLLLLVQTFSTWVTIIDFRINQSFIAAKLCQNRNRPQLHCNGNCVLMKKMRQQEKQQQNVPGPVKTEIASTVLFYRTYFSNILPFFPVKSKTHLPLINTGKPVDHSAPVFHPPAA